MSEPIEHLPEPVARPRSRSIYLLPNLLTTSGTARAANWDQYQCFTDDGYGRKRPCSAGYKSANPNWRAGDSCFTDDGYGRYRPCSAGYKAKHAK